MKLIYHHENLLKPVGGPVGYLYNLYHGLEQIQCQDIIFLSPTEIKERSYVKYRQFVPKKILDIRKALYTMNIVNRNGERPEESDEYEAIHFHSTISMYQNRKWLEDYKGKVVLTSHSPCALHKEYINELSWKGGILFKEKLEAIKIMDEYAFSRADHIIFPCKESEEAYVHTWNDYIKYRNASKILYVPTGIMECKAKRNRYDVRKEYGIPENAFVVSYVGRHNVIKGFGDLKEIGTTLLDKDIWFLIAGKEEPLPGINHSNWIEVGWTNDPHSIISASDIFILPNQETYFDLVLLEALSLGIPCLISDTGGNKYFSKYGNDAIKIYSGLEQAQSFLLQYRNKSKMEREGLSCKARQIYTKDFNIVSFAKRYVDAMNEIVKS